MEVLPWPAQSLDMKPIEYVLVLMKYKLRQLTPYPTNADALFQKLTEIWNSLPDNSFNNLIASMGNRCRAISNVNGSARKYRVGHKINSYWCIKVYSSMMLIRGSKNILPTVHRQFWTESLER